MSDQYGWKIVLDETTDITDKVRSFSIEASLDSFCRELSLDLIDVDFYDSLDFSVLPERPRIEVYTRVTDEVDEYGEFLWMTQGVYYIERPTFKVGLNITETGIWGRQSTAILGEPFAARLTKLWSEDTSFYAICAEVLEFVGLSWDANRCDIPNYTIYANTFEAQNQYPIDVLRSLVELIVGEEGFVVSDRLGQVWIKRIDREPNSSSYDVTDAVIQNIGEEPTWPDFGNRVKVSPPESMAPVSVELFVDTQCLGTDLAYINAYVQVSDGSGVPADNMIIDWSFSPENPKSVWYKHPSVGKIASQNSGEILVSGEVVVATGFNSLSTRFKPKSIVGIWAYADKTRQSNFAPEDKYVIDGKNVFLTENSFEFCDQTVVVSYYAAGMAQNVIIYHPMEPLYDDYGEYIGPEEFYEEDAEETYGQVLVVASVTGKEATTELYIDNSCKCPASLVVKVDPSTIYFNTTTTTWRPYNPFTDGNNPTIYELDRTTMKWMVPVITGDTMKTKAKITAYVEQGGVAVSSIINMAEMSGFGTLDWTSKATETIDVTENTEAINVIYGQSQCKVSSAIESVIGVWQYTRNESTGEDTKTGDNLYDSFNGKIIDLNTYVATGTELLVEYTSGGSVVNYLSPVSAGTAQVSVSTPSSSEKGLSQMVQITISEAKTGTETAPVPEGYYIKGPAQGTYVIVGTTSMIWWEPRPNGQSFGSWSLREKGTDKIIQGAEMSVQFTGQVTVTSNSIICYEQTPSQTMTITMNGPKGETASMLFTYVGYKDSRTIGY